MSLKTNFHTKEKPLIYTHLFMLAPLYFSIHLERYELSLMIALVIILSTLHHVFKKSGSEWWWQTESRKPYQTILLITEMTSSIALAIWGFQILRQRPITTICLALVIFLPIFVLYWSDNYKKYVLYHSIWHIGVSALLTLMILNT